MISTIMFLNERGDVLISRSYRETIPVKKVAETFRSQIVLPKIADRCPVKTVGSVSFLWVTYQRMYVVAVTRRNANATMIFQFLKKMISILKAYFGSFTEADLKENYVLIYEILDEILDFGYPQTTDADILKLYISSKGQKETMKVKEAQNISIQATGAISWRPQGIVYKKNEVFLDVVEKVNLLISAKGTVLASEVEGRIIMKSFLSGMPECKLGLNDKNMMQKEKGDKAGEAGETSSSETTRRRYKEVDIDNLTFHQCVKLGKFDSERTISFIPPDKEFELMRYRISDRIINPFKILSPIVRELGKTRLEIQVSVKALFSNKLSASNVMLVIPTPKNTASCKIRVLVGKAKYEAEKQGIVWRIPKFPGNTDYTISAEVSLIATTSGKDTWSRPPITMDFQVPMFTASGLHVRFLKIYEKSNYQSIKWVRYVTKAGKYEHRI